MANLECCFACGRAITRFPPAIVDTRDDQTVYVGPECFQKVKQAGAEGYQPPMGGPRLWLLPPLTRKPLVDIEGGVCATHDPFDYRPVESPLSTNAVDPQAQPSGTPSPREKEG